ncbi:DUF423 domain-containing protein [Mangrovibacillus cuniculi]|uniref:DUF423 domain-containing protein n=1 Tax=Mangrovibacillus cuniculi TaxID=2593652 RepID=A0A7S8HGC4_9BACI|nr:DUF423 domain-containing protein [Mangrovibacillus cuniculi]QPC47768.1 DUF423 domain-containing protein [Mangrovibacillus cuniculi]
MKLLLLFGAINGFLAVALGAFGAHGLEGRVPEKYLATWNTGVQYHMYHALGMLTVGGLAMIMGNGSMLFTYAGWAMQVGIVFFSFTLYVLTLTQISILGAVAPIGGVAFLVGWLLLAIAVMK